MALLPIFFITVFGLLGIIVNKTQSFSNFKFIPNPTGVHQVRPNDVQTVYELMLQVERGTSLPCPFRLRYVGNPSLLTGNPPFEEVLALSYEDIFAAPNITMPLTGCYPSTGKIKLVSSRSLSNSTILEALYESFGNSIDKRTSLDSLVSQLGMNQPFYVSLPNDVSLQCPDTEILGVADTLFFTSSVSAFNLPFIKNIVFGGPRIINIPLQANVRHLLAVRPGSTCVYRAFDDVQNGASSKPSETSSPTPSASHGDVPVSVPVPSVLATPTPSASLKGEASPTRGPSFAGPLPTREVVLDPTADEDQMESIGTTETTVSKKEAQRSKPLMESPGINPTSEPPSTMYIMETTPEPSEQPRPTAENFEDPINTDLPVPEASPNKPTMEPGASPLPEKGLCFPAGTRVQVEGGATRMIEELRLGDKVVVSASGKLSDVILWTHWDPTAVTEFVSLWTAGGQKLRLSEGHFLFVNNSLKAARKVQVGDVVDTRDGKSRVVQTGRERAQGLFNPQTAAGSILVEGVVASCYTEAVKAEVAHLALAPVRALLSSTFGRGKVQEKLRDALSKLSVKWSTRARNLAASAPGFVRSEL